MPSFACHWRVGRLTVWAGIEWTCCVEIVVSRRPFSLRIDSGWKKQTLVWSVYSETTASKRADQNILESTFNICAIETDSQISFEKNYTAKQWN